MKMQFLTIRKWNFNPILRIDLRVATEKRCAGRAAWSTCGSWSAVAVNVLAMVASNETICSLSVTGHQAFLGTRANILTVCGTGWWWRGGRRWWRRDARIATEEWGTGGGARITCGSGSAVAINVLAVVACNKSVGSLPETGHCTLLGARTDVLTVDGCSRQSRDGSDEWDDGKNKFHFE